MLAASVSAADKKEQFNEDESKVPAYSLPDPLVSTAGEKIDTPAKWNQQRRGEILRLFENEVYGRTPPQRLEGIRAVVTEGPAEALDGQATRKQVTVYFTAKDDGPRMDILIYSPRGKKSSPAFLGYNFIGNQATTHDPAVKLCMAGFKTARSRGSTITRPMRNREVPRRPAGASIG